MKAIRSEDSSTHSASSEIQVREAHASLEDRKVVPASLQKEQETEAPAAALELPDGRIIYGKTSDLLGASSALLLNALKELGVFGNDYDTPDGTGVRDYIHVVDLAKGHVKAVKKLEDNSGLSIYNLGTGKGYSVLDIVKNFEAATGIKIPYSIKPRRAGDVATCYSDATKAKKELGWEAEYDIKDMCADSWNFQQKNPNGYED